MKKIVSGWLLALVMVLCVSGAFAELPANLEVIESGAFEGDEALQGVLTLPESVKNVESRAFAETGVHALIIPEGCESVAADVLAGGSAAYVTFSGVETIVDGDALADVAYVFGPEGSAVSTLPGFYASESLYVLDGFFYSMTQEEAIPLCPVNPIKEGSVVLPKLVDSLPVRSLDKLVLRGCEAALSVPSYLDVPEGMTATLYGAMTAKTPVSSVTECTAGDTVTWTTEVTGAYGEVSYIWLFDTDGSLSSIITAEPSIAWTPSKAGLCVATVTAVDSLDDRATAAAAGVTVGEPVPVYRALLVGNTYPGTDSELFGCDTDVYAMRNVLNLMAGTDYAVHLRLNLSASSIQSAIGTTFADARDCDISLFYFSGHGTSAGDLVGVGNSLVSVGALRNWLDQIPGTKIVILDCCFSGMMIGKSDAAASPASFNNAVISTFSAFTKANNLANNGYVVITACSKNQKSTSLYVGTVAFGAFTYGLCYGSGYDEWRQRYTSTLYADVNGDGAITLREAYDVALERVAYLSGLISSMDQSAQYYGDDDFVLWVRGSGSSSGDANDSEDTGSGSGSSGGGSSGEIWIPK